MRTIRVSDCLGEASVSIWEAVMGKDARDTCFVERVLLNAQWRSDPLRTHWSSSELIQENCLTVMLVLHRSFS